MNQILFFICGMVTGIISFILAIVIIPLFLSKDKIELAKALGNSKMGKNGKK